LAQLLPWPLLRLIPDELNAPEDEEEKKLLKYAAPSQDQESANGRQPETSDEFSSSISAGQVVDGIVIEGKQAGPTKAVQLQSVSSAGHGNRTRHVLISENDGGDQHLKNR
jgi:hypothetical protein